jgi:glycosyltransferase involved in cell wall biosynthesis
MKYMSDNRLPLVSFIIPTLNAITHLPRCIESIRMQEYPSDRIEIIISDGGSTDGTVRFCHTHKLTVIDNPDILHEPGKSRAAGKCRGDLIFYLDSDNTLARNNWIRLMIKPYTDKSGAIGYLPQTVPPPDSGSLNRYLGYLFTDPFSWFVYQDLANPRDYRKIYRPDTEKPTYQIYRFNSDNPPLFGFSQGAGTVRSYVRSGPSYWDDITAGLFLTKSGKVVAYVPDAYVYHYHVSGLRQFISKYSWRVRNNLTGQIPEMGFMKRRKLLSADQNIRSYLYVPYALSLIFPLWTSIYLSIKYRDKVMLWHMPVTLALSLIMIKEIIRKYIYGSNNKLPRYE